MTRDSTGVDKIGNPGQTRMVGQPLGKYLRDLRTQKSVSLKNAAPEMGLSYSYLSKLENGHLEPSQATIDSLANYYNVDEEELAVLAGKLPDDVVEILQGNPEEAIRLLRQTFGTKQVD